MVKNDYHWHMFGELLEDYFRYLKNVVEKGEGVCAPLG